MPLRPHQKKALEAMARNSKGQVIVPTGGGKTMCMIHDAIKQFDTGWKTIVVVAPRILLAEQLSSEFLEVIREKYHHCLLYTSPSPRDLSTSRMPSSA